MAVTLMLPKRALPALALLAACIGARADCVDDAATYHSVNAPTLRAILWNESRMNPAAISRNGNGTVDVGIAQYNSSNFASLQSRGISPESLLDACVGSYVAAWHLSRQTQELGNTWFAVGAYHSRTPILNNGYGNDVHATLVSWGLRQREDWPFPAAPKSAAEARRLFAKRAAASDPTASKPDAAAGMVVLNPEP